MPIASALATRRSRTPRWSYGHGDPSAATCRPGAQAKPGWPASRTSRSASGTSRMSPDGVLSASWPNVMASCESNTANSGVIPTPRSAADSNPRTGTVRDLGMPLLSAQTIVTPTTPCSASSAATAPDGFGFPSLVIWFSASVAQRVFLLPDLSPRASMNCGQPLYLPEWPGQAYRLLATPLVREYPTAPDAPPSAAPIGHTRLFPHSVDEPYEMPQLRSSRR